MSTHTIIILLQSLNGFHHFVLFLRAICMTDFSHWHVSTLRKLIHVSTENNFSFGSLQMVAYSNSIFI